MYKKQYGMSLIEVLLSLTVLSIVSLGFIQWAAEQKEKELQANFSKEISGLLSAVDKRLIIDGLSENDLLTQLDDDKFIQKAFISKDQECGNKNDGWNPKNGENLMLLPCNMWKQKIPYGFDIEPSVISSNDKVRSVSFVFSLSKKELDRDKSIFIQIQNLLSKEVNANMLGTQSYSLITSSGDSIGKMECLKIKDNCRLKAEFKVTPMFILSN